MSFSHLKNLKQNQKFILGLILVFSFSFIYATFLSNKTFSTAEGWYSYYAKEILDGKAVYSDFEYLFTPAYMYLIAGIIKLFGYKLIVLRILGIFIYAGLASLIYIILSRIFSYTAATISAITGIFYLQSEVYSVFYDYVRVMDIFSHLAILFMVIAIQKIYHGKGKNIALYLWGIFSSLFFLVKQNMGGLFLVFSMMMLVFTCLYLEKSLKQSIFLISKYICAIAVPILLFIVICSATGILKNMIQSVLFGAVEAKGGLIAILFQWICNGYISFIQVLLWGIVFTFFVYLMKRVSMKYLQASKANKYVLASFSLILFVGLLFTLQSESLGIYYANQRRLDVTLPFIITVCMMIYLGINCIWCIIKHQNKNIQKLKILSLLGACFSFSYGAGMSGGLSIGESGLCVALVIAILFDCMNFSGDFIPKFAISCYCIFLSISCISYKLVVPCQWWGINESSVYESTSTTSIPLLEGIKLSKNTKKMYEDIVKVVQKNTEQDDVIYSFPQMPIFYLLCDRNDPGVFSKVEWFDVSTNESLEKDINILKETKPSAIIIYNLYDDTYKGHEKSFNSNKKSGTREIRDSLYELVNTENYKYAGTYISEDNNISVYILDKDAASEDDLFEKGSGTKESPYLISSEDELVNLAMKVNQGYSFEGVYFKQTTSLDLSDIIWVPAGYNENTTFMGNYNKNGYFIKNVNSGPKNSNVPFGKKIFK